jgi:DNA-directed RNA polymerase subunit RPC12/RpoP
MSPEGEAENDRLDGGKRGVAKVNRVTAVDLDIDWICPCGEENDFTRIITTDDFIECLECGRRFRVKVSVTIDDVK